MAKTTGRLLILCGAARSGKSTWVNEWMNTEPTARKVIVNADNIRLALHNQRYNKYAEMFVFAINDIMVRTLFNQGMYVVVDETSTTIGSIRKWLQIDPDAEFHFQNTPKYVVMGRCVVTGQTDLIDKGVIDRHFANLVKLSQYGFDAESEDIYRTTGHYECDNKTFDIPDEKYIRIAVEYIRKEVKNVNTN